MWQYRISVKCSGYQWSSGRAPVRGGVAVVDPLAALPARADDHVLPLELAVHDVAQVDDVAGRPLLRAASAWCARCSVSAPAARAESARFCAPQFTQATVGNSVPLERHSRPASSGGPQAAGRQTLRDEVGAVVVRRRPVLRVAAAAPTRRRRRRPRGGRRSRARGRGLRPARRRRRWPRARPRRSTREQQTGAAARRESDRCGGALAHDASSCGATAAVAAASSGVAQGLRCGGGPTRRLVGAAARRSRGRVARAAARP